MIRDCGKIAAPLTQLISSKHPFQWSPKVDAAFRKLKDMFTNAPVLIYPDSSLQFVVEMDASDTDVRATLSKRSSNSEIAPLCILFSFRLSPARQNYDVGNRELLAVVLALQEWRHWLERAEHPFIILIDHKNLAYLQSAKHLKCRQARGSLLLSRFNFTLSSLMLVVS